MNHAYMIRQVQRMSKEVKQKGGSPEKRGWELCNLSARAARQANNLHMKLHLASALDKRRIVERERRLRKGDGNGKKRECTPG